MKLMKSGSGFFLCVGIGIATSYLPNTYLVLYSILGAIIIAVLHVVLKSEHYCDYLENCKGNKINIDSKVLQKFIIQQNQPVKPSIIRYIVMSFILNCIIIFSVIFIIRLFLYIF